VPTAPVAPRLHTPFTGVDPPVSVATAYDGGNGQNIVETAPGQWQLDLVGDPVLNLSFTFDFTACHVAGKTLVFRVRWKHDAVNPWYPGSSSSVWTPWWSVAGGPWQRMAPTVPADFDPAAQALWIRPPVVTAESYRIATMPAYDTVQYEADLVRWAASGATVDVIGQSIEGRPIRRLTMGAGPKTAIVVCSGHTFERGKDFVGAGFLDWLLGSSAAATLALSRGCYIVYPRPNPDGWAHAWGRTDTAGKELNRIALTAPDLAYEGPDQCLLDTNIEAMLAAHDVRAYIDVHDSGALGVVMFCSPGSSALAGISFAGFNPFNRIHHVVEEGPPSPSNQNRSHRAYRVRHSALQSAIVDTDSLNYIDASGGPGTPATARGIGQSFAQAVDAWMVTH